MRRIKREMMKSRNIRVSCLFDDFITRKSQETGLTKLRVTEKIVKDGFIDENILNEKVNQQLWGVFANVKKKK
jgi:hypothetical protein